MNFRSKSTTWTVLLSGVWYHQQSNPELLPVLPLPIALPAGFPLSWCRQDGQDLGFAPFLGRAQQPGWRKLKKGKVNRIVSLPWFVMGVRCFVLLNLHPSAARVTPELVPRDDGGGRGCWAVATWQRASPLHGGNHWGASVPSYLFPLKSRELLL